MLKAVSQAEAHAASSGESQTRFKKACYIFEDFTPSELLNNYLCVIWKTTSNRFKNFMVKHLDTPKNNAVASGIFEVRGER